jgi:hypothetical protein
MAVGAKTGTAEDLDGSETSEFLWHMIPQIDGMIKGKRPEVKSGLSRPMDSLMEHHGSGPLGNGANGAFGDTILVMGADAGVADGLALVGAILHKIVGTKRGVVGMIIFNINAVLERPTFELVFRFQGFANAERDLMRMTDDGRSMVDE